MIKDTENCDTAKDKQNSLNTDPNKSYLRRALDILAAKEKSNGERTLVSRVAERVLNYELSKEDNEIMLEKNGKGFVCPWGIKAELLFLELKSSRMEYIRIQKEHGYQPTPLNKRDALGGIIPEDFFNQNFFQRWMNEATLLAWADFSRKMKKAKIEIHSHDIDVREDNPWQPDLSKHDSISGVVSQIEDDYYEVREAYSECLVEVQDYLYQDADPIPFSYMVAMRPPAKGENGLDWRVIGSAEHFYNIQALLDKKARLTEQFIETQVRCNFWARKANRAHIINRPAPISGKVSASETRNNPEYSEQELCEAIPF